MSRWFLSACQMLLAGDGQLQGLMVLLVLTRLELDDSDREQLQINDCPPETVKMEEHPI